MGRLLPIDCNRCKGVIDWGDFGDAADKPTCKCFHWYWDTKTNTWEYKYVTAHQIRFALHALAKRLYRKK